MNAVQPEAPSHGSIIFIVCGNEDVYSSYSSWTVGAYVEKSKADEHAAKAQAWHDKNSAEFREDYEDYSILDRPNPYDTYQNSGREDRRYTVCPLFVHFDVENHLAEARTLEDRARELGYLPP